jgi:predicted transcriptional regulator
MDTQIETRTEYVARKLNEAGHKNWPEIADGSGVPEKTMSKIAYGETKDPRESTVSALVSYFEQQEKRRANRRTEDKNH